MCLAVPGRVVSRREQGGTLMATVDFRGALHEVCLECVPEAGPGDWVLVHLGLALDLLDEQAALERLAVAEQIGLPDEEAVGPGSPT